METDPLQSLIQLALDDAARRTKRDASTLKVISAEPVTWPNGALGCPQRAGSTRRRWCPASGYASRPQRKSSRITPGADRRSIVPVDRVISRRQ
jgi:hypothetical protein